MHGAETSLRNTDHKSPLDLAKTDAVAAVLLQYLTTATGDLSDED